MRVKMKSFFCMVVCVRVWVSMANGDDETEKWTERTYFIVHTVYIYHVLCKNKQNNEHARSLTSKFSIS